MHAVKVIITVYYTTEEHCTLGIPIVPNRTIFYDIYATLKLRNGVTKKTDLLFQWKWRFTHSAENANTKIKGV